MSKTLTVSPDQSPDQTTRYVHRRCRRCKVWKRGPARWIVCEPCKESNTTKQNAEYRRKNWIKILLSNAATNSKARGHGPPTVTAEWILEELERNPNCYYTGVPLIPPTHDERAGRKCPWAPSLDRIDSSQGYTPENTRVTSWLWNCLRGDVPVEVAFEHLHQMARCIVYGHTPKFVKNPKQ